MGQHSPDRAGGTGLNPRLGGLSYLLIRVGGAGPVIGVEGTQLSILEGLKLIIEAGGVQLIVRIGEAQLIISRSGCYSGGSGEGGSALGEAPSLFHRQEGREDGPFSSP